VRRKYVKTCITEDLAEELNAHFVVVHNENRFTEFFHGRLTTLDSERKKLSPEPQYRKKFTFSEIDFGENVLF
jgi:hypothetical protein